MFRLIARSVGAMVLGVAFGMGLIAEAGAQQNSGFLKDYSRLEAGKDTLGVDRRVWKDPAFPGEKYQKLIVEPVVFYPAPKASDRVSMQTLNEIRDYVSATVRNSLGKSIPLADKPGPGVARLRLAITAASVDTGLKPYQLLPVAMVFTAATSASGTAKHDVKLAVETEVTDSESGKLLWMAVREAKGVEVKGDEKLTLTLAKPRIDQWAKAGEEEVASRMKQSRAK